MALIFHYATRSWWEKNRCKNNIIIKKKCEEKSRVFDREVIIQDTNDTSNQLVNAERFNTVYV